MLDNAEKLVKKHIPEYKGVTDSIPARISNFAQKQLGNTINDPFEVNGMTQFDAFSLAKEEYNGND